MRLFLLSALVVTFAAASSASIITTGTFSIAGTVFVTGVAPPGGITLPGTGFTCPFMEQCIVWQDANSSQNNKADISGAGLPNGDITSPTFAGNDNANISNLINPPDTPPSFPPIAFMSFAPGTTVTTVLNASMIPFGVFGQAQCGLAPAPGQVCTPTPTSVFNLQNTAAGGSTAQFTVMGTSADGTATWRGDFTASFVTMPYQSVIAQFQANGFVSNTFAGSIALTPTPIPEPETWALLALGGVLIGASRFRRRGQQH
jgi:hypothetical protein